MNTGQQESWYSASQLASEYPKTIGRLDRLALQRLNTLAVKIARGRGIAPRKVIDPTINRWRSVEVSAFPLSVWVEARGLMEAPAGLKAQPTEFNGVMFRSRLEARTAVKLTSLGLTWEYEPEGGEHPSGRYWPDFRVVFEDEWAWLEVKHQQELPRGRDHRWSELVRTSGYDMIVSYGLWRPVPFEDSGPPRMFKGVATSPRDVHWSEITSLYPEGAANEVFRQRLIRAYRDAADERFGTDNELMFAV